MATQDCQQDTMITTVPSDNMDTTLVKEDGFWRTVMTEHHFMTTKAFFTDTLTVMDTTLKMSSTVMTDTIPIETELEDVDSLITDTICQQIQTIMVFANHIVKNQDHTMTPLTEVAIADTNFAILSL